MVKETDKRMAKYFQGRVKADLARRGISDKDLDGIDFETDVDTHTGSLDGFMLRVRLKGQAPLEYVMANRPGAVITEGENLIPDEPSKGQRH